MLSWEVLLQACVRHAALLSNSNTVPTRGCIVFTVQAQERERYIHTARIGLSDARRRKAYLRYSSSISRGFPASWETTVREEAG